MFDIRGYALTHEGRRPGVREIRIRGAAGAFRIIYLATLADRVRVLHAFQKKTHETAQRDIDLAARRLREWKARQ